MRNWSISAGRIFGVELRIHLSFVFLLVFVALTESAPPNPMNPGRSLALVGIIFGCVILHELGHALVARREGIHPKAIILLPIGGVTLLDETQQAPDPKSQAWKRDIRIAMAGPLVNLAIAAGAAGIFYLVAPQVNLWAGPYVHSSNLARSFVWANLWLAAFNLLPAYPMDGGRVLRALFARRMDSVSATKRAVTIGQSFAALFMLTGMLWNVWMTMIGFFLFLAGQLEERSAVFQSV